MNNINHVEKLIENYKIHLKKDRLKDEIYKWQLLTKFKGRPRLDALDFAKKITSINFANLIYHSGITVIRRLAFGNPTGYKNYFELLFDETILLTSRIKAFDTYVSSIYNVGSKDRFFNGVSEREIERYFWGCSLKNITKCKLNSFLLILSQIFIIFTTKWAL